MKNSTLHNRGRRAGFNICLFLSFITCVFIGCSDDVDIRNGLNVESSDGFYIKVPNVESSANFALTRNVGYDNSRASIEASLDEANIENLYLVAIGTVDNSFQVIKLDDSKVPGISTDSEKLYKDYGPVNLLPGTYRLYVVANLDEYIEGSVDGKSKDEIESLVLNFADNSNNFILDRRKLPMCCLPEDIKTGASDNTKVGSAGITISSTTRSIYADLTFLCSKVRYTLLFDKEDPSTSFPESNVDFEDEVNLKYVMQHTALRGGTIDISKLENVTGALNKVEYPDESKGTDKYLEISKVTQSEDIPVSLEKIETWSNESQRAWQGVVYLPENLTDAPTEIHFKPTGVDMLSDYSFTLQWGEGDNLRGLERGKFYDLVGKIQSADLPVLNLSVSDWTTQKLSYSLHGPYELIVEKTEIDVVSGAWSESFCYRSDVLPQDIDFAYPQIEITEGGMTRKVDFYIAEVVKAENSTEQNPIYETNSNGDYLIHVKVNPEVPYSVLNKLTDDTKKQPYKYFEIIAGNLQKKIAVNDMNLKPVLEVSPKEIMIDVRELLSSGINSDVIEIDFNTNITDNPLILTCDMENILNGGQVLNVTFSEGVSIQNDILNEREGRLFLNLSGLLDGQEFWKEEKTITLTFSVKVDDSLTLTENVIIKVKPYLSEYVIHFRCSNPDYEWDKPHVYIYQCLEMPSDLLKDKNNPTKGRSPFAGKTVGYYEDETTNPAAALEYLFSNNISFRGWAYYGGTVDPYASGTYEAQGFVHVGGTQPKNSPFNPRSSNENYYNFERDFNSIHQKGQVNWECEICRENYKEPKNFNQEFHDDIDKVSYKSDKAGSHTFAGVSMEKEEGENEGWYKYTLTGLATPGKTLIVFFNGHIWDDLDKSPSRQENEKHYRYPTKDNNGNDTAGLPLFDFNDHEGWFVFDGNGLNRDQNFVDDKPILPEQLTNDIYRLYWPISRGPKITVTSSEGAMIAEDVIGSFDAETGYYYSSFNLKDVNSINVEFLIKSEYDLNGYNKSSNLSVSEFTNIETNDGFLYATLEIDKNGSLNFHSGTPNTLLWDLSDSKDKSSITDDLYLRGEFNEWRAEVNYKFENVKFIDDGWYTQVWKLEDISLSPNDSFKIADSNWGNVNLGSNNSKIEASIPFTDIFPNKETGQNIVNKDDFNGSIYLIKYLGEGKPLVGGIYSLIMVP